MDIFFFFVFSVCGGAAAARNGTEMTELTFLKAEYLSLSL